VKFPPHLSEPEALLSRRPLPLPSGERGRKRGILFKGII